jgi:hypothetical protein
MNKERRANEVYLDLLGDALDAVERLKRVFNS